MSKITTTKFNRLYEFDKNTMKFVKKENPEKAKNRISIKCLNCEGEILISVDQIANTHKKCRNSFRKEMAKIKRVTRRRNNK